MCIGSMYAMNKCAKANDAKALCYQFTKYNDGFNEIHMKHNQTKPN